MLLYIKDKLLYFFRFLKFQKSGKWSILISIFFSIEQKPTRDLILDISSLVIINVDLFKNFLILNQKILELSLGSNKIPIPFGLFIFYFVKFIFDLLFFLNNLIYFLNN